MTASPPAPALDLISYAPGDEVVVESRAVFGEDEVWRAVSTGTVIRASVTEVVVRTPVGAFIYPVGRPMDRRVVPATEASLLAVQAYRDAPVISAFAGRSLHRVLVEMAPADIVRLAGNIRQLRTDVWRALDATD